MINSNTLKGRGENMRKKLLSLLLNFTTSILMADDIHALLEKENGNGCKIAFLKKEEKKCFTEKRNLILENDKENKRISTPSNDIHKEQKRIRRQLKNLVLEAEEEAFQQYKRKKEKHIQKLLQQLTSLKKNFHNYKIKKEKELKRISNKLTSTKKHLSKTIKKLKYTQQKDDFLKKRLKKKKKLFKSKKITRKKITQKKKRVQKRDLIEKEIRPIKKLPDITHLPWIEIDVENNINIYQLALKYYKKKEDYPYIYAANKDIIPKNLNIKNGMHLKIPINYSFKEQPFFLNTD
jgi:chromosome segregation ATPase